MYDDASILWISKIGSIYDTTTVFRNKDGGLNVKCGCFRGTLEEFEAKVEETHRENKFGKEYKALIALIKIHFEIGEDKIGYESKCEIKLPDCVVVDIRACVKSKIAELKKEYEAL